MVVPFPPGGPSDVVARIIADGMSRRAQSDVIIENVGGAGGTIGTARVAAATPDGYTLLGAGMGSHVAAPALFPNLRYDSTKDFEPIGLVSNAPVAVVAQKGFSGQGPQGIHRLGEKGRRRREAGPWRHRLGLAYGLPAVQLGGRSEAEARSPIAAPARRSTI